MPKNHNPKNDCEQEHFLVTTVLYFFHESLLNAAKQRVETLASTDNLKKDNIETTPTVFNSLRSKIESSLYGLEKGLSDTYSEIYKDKKNLIKNLAILRKERWNFFKKLVTTKNKLLFKTFSKIIKQLKQLIKTTQNKNSNQCDLEDFFFEEMNKNLMESPLIVYFPLPEIFLDPPASAEGNF